VRGWLGCLLAAGLLGAGAYTASAWAQAGIYTCIDGKGRRLTSDRPILDCIDREQQELGPTGKVIRKIGPSMTAEEQRAIDEKQRQELEDRQRVLEERRRDRVLLARYPDRATHDKERQKALQAVDDVIATATRRTSELRWQRKKLETDLEFYGGDMKKAPPMLRRRFEENDNSIAAQLRFVDNQEEEKKRINARYDEENKHLAALWETRPTPPAPAASTAAKK
jgi:hypothetical protein